MLDGLVESRLALMRCYTSLLQNWATFLLSTQDASTTQSAAVSELVSHVNKLCLSTLQLSSSTSTQSLVLEFYELTAYIASNPSLNMHIRIVIPPSTLVYILHFSSSPVIIARLCGILSGYKQGFQTAMATSRVAYDPQYINEFNGFLMDICNCLWRSRAFNAKDANAHACLMQENVTSELARYVADLIKGSSLTSLFTLSASPTLGLLATSFLRDLEDVEMEQGSGGLDTRHAGPVSKTSLTALGRNGGVSLTWDEFRLGVLGYLEQNGMDGVGRLMHGTMTTLMKRS